MTAEKKGTDAQSKKKNIEVYGKKKRATARAVIKPGKGIVRINGMPLAVYTPETSRFIAEQPVLVAPDLARTVDIDVNVVGGGPIGQACASRTAIARAMVAYSKDEKVRKMLTDFDDKMLSGDSRVKETCKPHDSAPRASRQKSYR